MHSQQDSHPNAAGNSQHRQPMPPAYAASRHVAHSIKPVSDPLAALERARRIAFEEEEAERWDGMS